MGSIQEIFMDPKLQEGNGVLDPEHTGHTNDEILNKILSFFTAK